MDLFWLFYEVLLSLFMLACIVLLLVYSMYLTVNYAPVERR